MGGELLRIVAVLEESRSGSAAAAAAEQRWRQCVAELLKYLLLDIDPEPAAAAAAAASTPPGWRGFGRLPSASRALIVDALLSSALHLSTAADSMDVESCADSERLVAHCFALMLCALSASEADAKHRHKREDEYRSQAPEQNALYHLISQRPQVWPDFLHRLSQLLVGHGEAALQSIAPFILQIFRSSSRSQSSMAVQLRQRLLSIARRLSTESPELALSLILTLSFDLSLRFYVPDDQASNSEALRSADSAVFIEDRSDSLRKICSLFYSSESFCSAALEKVCSDCSHQFLGIALEHLCADGSVAARSLGTSIRSLYYLVRLDPNLSSRFAPQLLFVLAYHLCKLKLCSVESVVAKALAIVCLTLGQNQFGPFIRVFTYQRLQITCRRPFHRRSHVLQASLLLSLVCVCPSFRFCRQIYAVLVPRSWLSMHFRPSLIC